MDEDDELEQKLLDLEYRSRQNRADLISIVYLGLFSYIILKILKII
jgi:hypothetical protein